MTAAIDRFERNLVDPAAAPGWYQAEADFEDIERYWDGSQWSVDTRPIAGAIKDPAVPSVEEVAALLRGADERLQDGPCDVCGRNPARHVKYGGVTGLLLARSNWSSQGRLCVACSSGLFRQVQSKLLLTGWWSLTSFLITPFLLFANFGRLGHHRRSVGAAHVADRELDNKLSGRPLILRTGPLVIASIALVATVNSIVSSPADAAGVQLTPTTVVPMVARTSLAIGDCFDMDSEFGIPDDITPMPCVERHDFELFGLHELDAGPFPGKERVDKSGVDYCITRFASYVGIEYEESVYEVEYLFPTELGWAGGDRVIECLISGDNPDAAGGLVGRARSAGY